ncbi:MAG: ABC transporter ATP-binding protein [Hyphomicrobiales bacterium]|nr:ABC transporter ATP-binding protein [Hyphomicrobiales bacterium]
MIKVKDFCKSYGNFAAVKDLSFEVGAGDILGLVGSNGAGKTTTLRTLSGIIAPTAGSLEVAGHDIVTASIAAKRCLGYIPDDPRLFDTLTVWEHLAFSAAAYGVAGFEPIAEELLTSFDLMDKRDSLAHDLSRGMRQKVAIASAYLHDPQVILFDEPLTGLDPRGIRAIQQSMRDRAEAGAAVVISSHLLSLVENLCSHLLVLVNGECRLFGTMDEVLRDVDQSNGDTALEAAFFAITHDGHAEA